MKWKKIKGSVTNESWMGKSFVDDDKEPDKDVGVQPQREMCFACHTVVARGGDVQVVSYRWKEVLGFETKMKRRVVKASSMGGSCTVCRLAHYRDGQ
ncbi:hypothetical protein MRB53_022283 [Persea americana]|uniref:Uncharacterized protein n=1 Tax=Persea americana TaxID=3435 RepID=A0ACC2L6I4_PERAE|nr:hypothetical protein MRB53_022283 [Persea americana]